MSLWKEPPTASCREKPGPADTRLAVASATSSDFVMIEFQVSISILIPTTPERMPRDLDGARSEDGEVATALKWPPRRVCPLSKALRRVRKSYPADTTSRISESWHALITIAV